MIISDRIKKFIKRHEALRLSVYKCTQGYDTIGYGHRVLKGESFADGITKEQAEALFEKDLENAYHDVRFLVKNIENINEVRMAVLLDMSFNLGLFKLSEFRRMLLAISNFDFPGAAYEMKNSLWYKQVKTRGVENAILMLRGTWE